MNYKQPKEMKLLCVVSVVLCLLSTCINNADCPMCAHNLDNQRNYRRRNE